MLEKLPYKLEKLQTFQYAIATYIPTTKTATLVFPRSSLTLTPPVLVPFIITDSFR